jgi:aspartate kinase
LFATALTALNVPACSLRGGEAGLRATGRFGHGRLESLDVGSISELLAHDVVPVITGFQAQRADGQTTTLGRGGSDATAIFLAGILNADACHLVTDVTAVCDCDPRTNPDARPLPHLTHRALLQLAASGSEVVQYAAAEFAHRFRTELHIYHFAAPFFGPAGTVIGNAAAVRSAS